VQWRGAVLWFNLIIYDPLHLLQEFTVQYEQCFGYDYFDVVSQMLSYDWGMVAERATTVIVSLFTDS
jgi:hypothetical protein